MSQPMAVNELRKVQKLASVGKGAMKTTATAWNIFPIETIMRGDSKNRIMFLVPLK